ncbi:MAG: hypothetical protein MK180_06045 [Rhodobacteraceae bacterium]|nr:hypothetical protein [Paracoccaceae bacterium]
MGELAVLADVARTASIRASSDAEVTAVAIDQIPQTLEGLSLQAALSRAMARPVAQRLIRTTNLLRQS